MTRLEKITEFLESLTCDIDLAKYADEKLTSYDDLREAIEDANGFDVEIIYHVTALEYLMKNDPSLSYSCELAADMGIETRNINSELLASLLASQNARESFESLEDEITTFFENLDAEQAEQEDGEK